MAAGLEELFFTLARTWDFAGPSFLERGRLIDAAPSRFLNASCCFNREGSILVSVQSCSWCALIQVTAYAAFARLSTCLAWNFGKLYHKTKNATNQDVIMCYLLPSCIVHFIVDHFVVKARSPLASIAFQKWCLC